MMKKFTNTQKVNGELAVRMLSKKAQEYYEGSSMLDVYEIDEWRDGGGVDHSYSVRGEIEADGLTLEELGAELESLQDEVEDLED